VSHTGAFEVMFWLAPKRTVVAGAAELAPEALAGEPTGLAGAVPPQPARTAAARAAITPCQTAFMGMNVAIRRIVQIVAERR
jgi:hypothetical protein